MRRIARCVLAKGTNTVFIRFTGSADVKVQLLFLNFNGTREKVNGMVVYVCACVCACVSEKERERERET